MPLDATATNWRSLEVGFVAETRTEAFGRPMDGGVHGGD